jgi:hypothetical protein
MATRSLRLNQETQGTVAGESRRKMVLLPEGSKIALIGQIAEHPEMVEVSWNGQSVRIFAIDFEARTKDDARPLAKATSVGDRTESEAGIKLNTLIEPKIPANTPPARSPRVRRFNSAGRELF